MASGGNFTNCNCGPGTACQFPTEPVATVGLCLADGTPIAVTIVRDCAGSTVQEGWINLGTGVFTAGQPPVGTVACGDSRSIEVSGTFCDVDPATGDVLGLVLVEYSYAADGSIASVRLVDAVTGQTYTPTGDVTVCPAGVEQPDLDLIQLCDTDPATGVATAFVRDYRRDENGVIVGHADYTLTGEPYTAAGTVGLCAPPCRDTSTLMVCDLPTDGKPTPVLTDTVAAPYEGIGAGAEPVAGGAAALWAGGTLTIPATDTGPGPDHSNQHLRSFAATVQAARPACDAGTATVTASINVERTGPDAAFGGNGLWELWVGGTRLAAANTMGNAPVGYTDTLTVTAHVPAADLAAGNVLATGALETWHTAAHVGGWIVDQATTTVTYDQAGCDAQFLRSVVTDCETGQVVSVTDTTLDGDPYTVVGEVGQCQIGGGSTCCPPETRLDVETGDLCVIDDTSGDVIGRVLVERVYDDQTGTLYEQRIVDPATGDPVEVPAGASIGVCPPPPCQDTSTLLLCDVDALDTITVLDTAGVQDSDGWQITSFTDGGCAGYNPPDGPVPGPAVWSGGYLGIRADRSLGSGSCIGTWPGYDTAPIRWVLTKTFTAAQDGMAVITADPLLADGGARVRVNGTDVGLYAQWNQPAVGGSSQVPVTAGLNVVEIEVRDVGGPNWVRGRLDIVLTRTEQFLRRTVTDCETGQVVSVTDTTLDGQPYTVTGEVGQCEPTAQCCPPPPPETRLDVETKLLCVRDTDTGDTIAQVIVERVYDDQTGLLSEQRLTDLDGAEYTLPAGSELVKCPSPDRITRQVCVVESGQDEFLTNEANAASGVDTDWVWAPNLTGVWYPMFRVAPNPIWSATDTAPNQAHWVAPHSNRTVCPAAGETSPQVPGTWYTRASWNLPANVDPASIRISASILNADNKVVQWRLNDGPWQLVAGGTLANPAWTFLPTAVPGGRAGMNEIIVQVLEMQPAVTCPSPNEAGMIMHVAATYDFESQVWTQVIEPGGQVYYLDENGVRQDAIPAGKRVVPCGGDGACCPWQDAETVTLCDTAADGTVTAFLRHLHYAEGSDVPTVVDTALDATSPYTPTGTVVVCQPDQCPRSFATQCVGIVTRSEGSYDNTSTIGGIPGQCGSVQGPNDSNPAAGAAFDCIAGPYTITSWIVDGVDVIAEGSGGKTFNGGPCGPGDATTPGMHLNWAQALTNLDPGGATWVVDSAPGCAFYVHSVGGTGNVYGPMTITGDGSVVVDGTWILGPAQACDEVQYTKVFTQQCDGTVTVSWLDAAGTEVAAPAGLQVQCGTGCSPTSSSGPDVETLLLCDVAADGTSVQFLRHIVYDNMGAVASVADTGLDGFSPYTPAGTVGQCEPEPCASTVQTLRLCDLNPDVTPDAQGRRCAVPFLRHLVHDCAGVLTQTRDTTMDGTTPYSPVQVVDCGTGGVPAQVELAWPQTGIAEDPAFTSRQDYIYTVTNPETGDTAQVHLHTSSSANTACSGGVYNPAAPVFNNPTVYTLTLDAVAQQMTTFRLDFFDLDTFEGVTLLNPPPDRVDGDVTWAGSTITANVNNVNASAYWDHPPAQISYRYGNTGGGLACAGVSFEGTTLKVDGCCGCEPTPEPCRNTNTLMVCDLPEGGTPAPTVTDTDPTPFYPFPTGAPVAGGQTLWDGGVLDLPPGAGPQAGTTGTVNTLAATVQAPRPACDTGLAHVTVAVNIQQTGPDDGCGSVGHLRLFNGATQAALTLLPNGAPANWFGTVTVEADIPAADLAAGNVAVALALDAYDDNPAACAPSPRRTGWQLSAFTPTVVYDQAGCDVQFLRNVVTDCQTGAVVSVTDTTLDGQPYTVVGQVGQCAAGAGGCCPPPPPEPCRDTSTLLLCDVAADGAGQGIAPQIVDGPIDETGLAGNPAFPLLPKPWDALWSGGTLVFPADPDPSAGDGKQVYRTVVGQITAVVPPECVNAAGSVTISMRAVNDGPNPGAGGTGWLRVWRDGSLLSYTTTEIATPVGKPQILTVTVPVTAQDLAAGSTLFTLSLETFHGLGPKGWTVDQLAITADMGGCAVQFARTLTIDCETGAVLSVTDTTLDGQPYTVAGQVGQCAAGGAGGSDCCPGKPCTANNIIEQCRCDDTDGDGVADVDYMELFAVDCDGTITSVGTYTADLSGPYTPVAPVPCETAGAVPATGVQAHRIQLDPGVSWDAATVAGLQSVTVTAPGWQGTITTAAGSSTLFPGESATWSVVRDNDSMLVGPLVVQAGPDGPLIVNYTTALTL